MQLKTPFYWIILLLALVFTAQLRADSITLTTGEKITGTIKSETDTDVTIDVPVSASITDERVIQKSDIAKIEKEQPDEIAYQQLIQVQPNPQFSYSADTYNQILGSLMSFETSYPNSTYLPEIKKLDQTFQDEKRHVDAGEYKYLGRWISADEASRRQIQIVGLQIYGTMAQQATSGDLVGALQTFSAIEKNYGTTRVYPTAVTLAREIIAGLEQNLVVRMAAVKADEAQLKQTIAFTAQPAKAALIAEAKAEQDRYSAAVSAAIQSGVKWVPLIPRSLVSIQTLQKVAGSEATRLAAVPVAAMELSITKVDAARTAMDLHEYTTADTLLTQATTLWGQNEDARYTLESLKEQLIKMATPKPTPKPVATPTPRPLPTVVATPRIVDVATPAPAPEEKPFYMTIQGSLGIVAVILILGGIAAIVAKKKAAEQQEAQ